MGFQPSTVVANEGLGWDPLLKYINPGGDWNPGQGDNPIHGPLPKEGRYLPKIWISPDTKEASKMRCVFVWRINRIAVFYLISGWC